MDAQKREASSPKPLPCRTYSIGDRIRDPGAVPESVFWRTNDEDREKSLLVAVFIQSHADDLTVLLHGKLGMQMRNKGFGPEEGFAKDLVYYKWGPKTEKIPVSSFEYIQFILEWADDCLNDDQIYTQYGLGMPGLEREIVKPICERILELYTILFHYQANYPVSRKQRTNLEECFDNFIDASLYWGLIDFNSETAKYLQEQIDFPRETYVRELNNKK